MQVADVAARQVGANLACARLLAGQQLDHGPTYWSGGIFTDYPKNIRFR
jgi:hypothetical protein